MGISWLPSGGHRRHALRKRRGIEFEPLERRRLLAGEPVITEFMAKNVGFFQDGDGNTPDWIEIQNVGDAAVDLAGYRLTDTPDNLSRWVFPSRVVEPGRYIVVFASGQERSDYIDAGGSLHTNFSLGVGGEYLALVGPDGNIVSEYGDRQADYPVQSANISYGVAQQEILVDTTDEAAYWVPTDETVDGLWTQLEFDAPGHAFSTGAAALGWESNPDGRGSISNLITTLLPPGTGSIYARIEFDVQDSSEFTGLDLRMQYDDGFIAYLNGIRVAESNAATNAIWSSSASKSRSDLGAHEFEDFDLTEHVALLNNGANVLTIHGMSHSSDRGDMLIAPQLVATVMRPDAQIGYMNSPSPGSSNSEEESVFAGMVGDVSIDVEAGYFDEPFQVTVSSETPGAEIRYTTDGSKPTASTGFPYEGSIGITTTTTLRVAAFVDDYIPSNVDTGTYLFLEDVIRQSDSPPGLPTHWQQMGQSYRADYEMDPRIVDDPAYRDEIVEGLRSIRTMSITMHPDDFLGPQGLYMQSGDHGTESERPVTVEIIDPDGGPVFMVDAGIRNHGNSTRNFSTTLKRSFRLVFNPRYGPKKLEYPLFEDAATERFDNIVLHAGKLMDDTQLIRNSFGRDTLRDMGNVEGHATYVHLYINGFYWGLYNPYERADAQFAQEYFGGSDEDYDALLSNTEVTDGDTERYRAMWDFLTSGITSKDEYEAFQRQVNLDSLFDVLLVNQYMAHNEHEMRSIGSRVGDPNITFFVHDLDEGGMNQVTANESVSTFLPQGSYDRLRQHPEIRMRYADRIHKHLFNDGALTPDAVAERWEGRYEEIFSAVIGETARWGDSLWRGRAPREPVRRDVQMENAQNYLSETYFPQRTDALINQLRLSNIYPAVDAPVFNQFGGDVPTGFELMMSNPNDVGTVLYTLDGTDPREFGGETASTALVYDGSPIAIDQHSVVKSRVLSSGKWSALNDAEFSVLSNDLNADGRVTAADIDTLCQGVHGGDVRFDFVRDGSVDQNDLMYFVQTMLGTSAGDANLDGRFDSGDFVHVLQAGEFEDLLVENSTWAEGDWDCDHEFTSSDIVLALQAGTFISNEGPLASFALESFAARIDGHGVSLESQSLHDRGDESPVWRNVSHDDMRRNLNRAPEATLSAERESRAMDKAVLIRDAIFQQDDSIDDLLDAPLSIDDSWAHRTQSVV